MQKLVGVLGVVCAAGAEHHSTVGDVEDLSMLQIMSTSNATSDESPAASDEELLRGLFGELKNEQSRDAASDGNVMGMIVKKGKVIVNVGHLTKDVDQRIVGALLSNNIKQRFSYENTFAAEVFPEYLRVGLLQRLDFTDPEYRRHFIKGDLGWQENKKYFSAFSEDDFVDWASSAVKGVEMEVAVQKSFFECGRECFETCSTQDCSQVLPQKVVPADLDHAFSDQEARNLFNEHIGNFVECRNYDCDGYDEEEDDEEEDDEDY